MKQTKKEVIKYLTRDTKKHTIFGLDAARKLFDEFGEWECMFNLPPTPYSSQSTKENKRYYRELIINEIDRRNLGKYKKRFAKKELEIYLCYLLGKKYSLSDLDNLTKIILDCLKGRVFSDDVQIKRLIIEKELVNKELKEDTRNLLQQTIVKIRKINCIKIIHKKA